MLSLHKQFCEKFKLFWETWKSDKGSFENIIEWWEVGKVHIRSFCQQYTSHSSLVLKKTLEWLEKEIIDIERSMNDNVAQNLQELWTEKKNQLSSYLNEKVKGALVRSRFLTIRDMDGPSSYLFSLERKARQEKQMHALKDNNGHNTSDPVVMRRLAVDFYTDLYSAEFSDEQCRSQLLKNLPVLTSDHKQSLETDISFEEVTAAVTGLSSGRAPGLDGLPANLYKFFWNIIDNDYFEVLQISISEEILPLSCQRAVLTLLPKKGDLTHLRNWRLVAILGSDYTFFSKCLANRVNGVLHSFIHKDQSYCIKNRSITDNLHLVRDMFDFASYNNISAGFLSLDQEKAFNRVDCPLGQGCPLSGQLYSLIIEPLLCRLRTQLTGLEVNTLNGKHSFKLSAYADDVTVLIKNNSDVQCIKNALECYGKASSAKVNWQKSDALWCGRDFIRPSLPGGLQWGRAGFKYLGVFIGTEEYIKKKLGGPSGESVRSVVSLEMVVAPAVLQGEGTGL